MIQLPNRSWFIQKQGGKYITNVYSGSLGTNSQEGCINQFTFNYRVSIIVKDNDEISLHAECFWRTPWREDARIIGFSECDFAVTDEGIKDSNEWLVLQYKASYPKAPY